MYFVVKGIRVGGVVQILFFRAFSPSHPWAENHHRCFITGTDSTPLFFVFLFRSSFFLFSLPPVVTAAQALTPLPEGELEILQSAMILKIYTRVRTLVHPYIYS